MMPNENRGPLCVCRNCGVTYAEFVSLADYKGYCGRKCMKEKAKSLGWKATPRMRMSPLDGKADDLYMVLKKRGEIGSVFAPPKEPPPVDVGKELASIAARLESEGSTLRRWGKQAEVPLQPHERLVAAGHLREEASLLEGVAAELRKLATEVGSK
jgi:hypothetical protein